MGTSLIMDKITEDGKLKIKEMGANGLNTPAPINYETVYSLKSWKISSTRKMVLWFWLMNMNKGLW